MLGKTTLFAVIASAAFFVTPVGAAPASSSSMQTEGASIVRVQYDGRWNQRGGNSGYRDRRDMNDDDEYGNEGQQGWWGQDRDRVSRGYRPNDGYHCTTDEGQGRYRPCDAGGGGR
jgi:hypothetical protein